MRSIKTYDGTAMHRIADGTNPWIEFHGKPVDWTNPTLPRVECPCGSGALVVLPGVLDGTDTPYGVQRCDECDTYGSDLDAALALARHIGGVVKYESE